MALAEKSKLWTYTVAKEGLENVMRIDAENLSYTPSVEDDPLTMGRAITNLVEVPSVGRISFLQRRNYIYDYEQTQLLVEIALLYSRLVKQKKLTGLYSMGLQGTNEAELARRFNLINKIVSEELRTDPAGAYVELKRAIREEEIKLKHIGDKKTHDSLKIYIGILKEIFRLLGNTRLITLLGPNLGGYKIGDRSIYSTVFRPLITPDFMFTRLMIRQPLDGDLIDTYSVGKSDVSMFNVPKDIKPLYHLTPPEFKLTEDKYALLDLAKTVLSEHRPKEEEFLDPGKMRTTFMNIGRDLLLELAERKNIDIPYNELEELAGILVRYTIGFGLIEILLEDEKVQDITINGPVGDTPIFIVHGDYGECVTNIIPSRTDSESWASKLRLLSGRPLDEANPILDTELVVPKARARVAVIQKPLNPFGIAYAFRRHRTEPWTYPLFIKNRMINPLGAGLLSFLVDGARTLLFAGTRSSGKTSLLGSTLVEIMRKYRIITLEDTLELPTDKLRELGYNIQAMKVRSALTKGGNEVPADEGIRTSLRMGDSSLIVGEIRSSLRGDQEVMIVENGITRRIAIKNIGDLDLKSIYLPTLTNEKEMRLKKLSGFVKHPKQNQLIKLKTKTGREVIVTPDHSVFTHVNFKIAAINTNQLKPGDPVIIPSKIPCEFNDVAYINLLEVFRGKYRLENAEPYIRKAIKILGWKKASKICDVSDIYRYLLSTQKTRIPINSFLELMQESRIKYDLENLRIKKGTSTSIPAKFPINENIMRFLGYYLAEGNIDMNKIQITNSKPEIIEDIKNICEKEFGLKISQRKITGYGESVQMYICSRPLLDLLIYFGCGKTSFYKRIPNFVYGLSKRKICALLKGMYSGDGSFSSTEKAGNMIRYFSTSKSLVEDVSYALLSLGIVCRLLRMKPGKKGKKDCFIAEIKQRKYVEHFLNNVGFTHKNPKIIIKSISRSEDDSVSFDIEELEKHVHLPRKYRHLRRTKRCSKDYLAKISEEVKCSDELYNFVHGDFFIDRVKSIELINLKEPEYVYDLEVKSTQRFIGGFGGILLHNTEAKALYEAMRIGALANVVAGTIHGDSPYGVFDRVVNDLEVPRTSFKATDVIVISNPIKSPDGLKSWRRVLSLTEVRKKWEEDPLRENGFVDLLKYNTKTDELEATDELINGNSEILKSIAGNVKEWVGDWDAIWDNILLRAKMKKTLVDYSDKLKLNDLVEAGFVILSNDVFHKISSSVKEEVGSLDSKRIYYDWEEWLKRAIREKEYEER